MDTHSKLLALLASAALGLGLAGCAGSADASGPTYKVPTMAQMDKEKQVLNAERKDRAAKEYAAKVKAEKEAKAKAEAEAKAKAEAEAEAQVGSGAAVNRSGAVAKRSYQQRARSKTVKARKGKATTRSGGGGGDELSPEVLRRRTIELNRAERARNAYKPREDTSKVIVCVSGNCGN